MNNLKVELKLVELKAQMEELTKRPTSEHVLMNEINISALEDKYELSSSISALLKEIKALISHKASHTIAMPLHEKLSSRSVHISNQILNQINLVFFWMK